MALILNTMSGEDGGIGFIKLCNLINDMQDRAAKGDDAAVQIISIVKKFAKLIEVSQTI